MEIYVIDPKDSYRQVAVIDSYVSLIWTTRYYNCGDFELYLPADTSLLDVLQKDRFIIRDDDSSVMVIEKIGIQTDADNGNYFIVSGRSLESILYRRIFDRQFILSNSGTLADAVQAMVTECTTNHNSTPAHPYTYRQIQGLTVDTSSSYDGTMQVQFTGDTLLDGIISVCQPREVGIRMTLEGTSLIISLYKGELIEAVFSPEFDNLINSQYLNDQTSFANSISVAGEGEGNARKWYSRYMFTLNNPKAGLDLHEIFYDARNISSNNGEIGIAEYYEMLAAKAAEILADHSILEKFEAEVEPQASFEYKTDWNLGDVVTVTNEYGVTANPRIVEVIESWDVTGYKVIPTFDVLNVVS